MAISTAVSRSSSNRRQQRFREPGEVPLGDHRLVAVGVAPTVVDRAEHGGGVEHVHEGARSVVDRFAGDRDVVGVHHAVDEPECHPPRHERRLRIEHPIEQSEIRVRLVGRVRIVPLDGVVGEPAHERRIPLCGGELERPHPQVTRGDADEHRPRQHRLASHVVARRHDGQRAGRRHAEREHRRTDHVLAQHRPDGRSTVAPAGERRAARTLEVDVAPSSRTVDDLAEEQRPTIAELR